MSDNNGSGYSRYTRPNNPGNGQGRRDGAAGLASLSAYVPPQNIEAEQSTLGAMLLERAAIEKAAEILEKDDFYRDSHQILFEIITTLAQRDEPVDFITVQNELKNQDKLETIGGLSYLMALGDVLPSAANVEYYAKIVEEKAILRRLIAAAFEIVGMARGEIEDIGEVIDQAERAVFSVSQQRTAQYFAPLRSLLLAVFDKAEELGALKSAISGLPTGIHDFDMITSGLQNTDLIIVAARPSMGKCAKYDTLVDDPVTGERLTIEDCVRQEMPAVFGLSPIGEARPASISAWVDSGVKPCFRVRTCTGRTVEVTGHHPFLTAQGWTPLHALTVGHKIAVPRRVPAFGADADLPPNLVRLMAYFIAEGGLTGTTPSFTNTDPALVADFQGIIARHYPQCVVRQRDITYFVVRPTRREWKSSLNPVTTWLAELGLWGKLSEDKSFPDCVWRWPKAHLAEFLRVLMSCDGTIYGIGGYPRIEFAVASEKLAQDVHHALVRFGIVAKLWRKTPRCWRVEITEPQSVVLYQQEIGWVGEKATRFPELPPAARRSNNGHAPQEAWSLVRQALAAKRLSMTELARQAGETTRTGKFAGYDPHSNRSIPHGRLARYAEVLDDDNLRRLAGPDIYWDEIVSIEPTGEHQVYDLSVPDGANFIAQDVCLHNTSFCLSVAEHVALKENKPVAIFSLEMSKEQLALRMLCSQAQVNSHKLRTGHLNEDEWGKLAEVVQGMYEAPIFIDDATETSALTMRAKCRRLMAEHGLGLVVVDYLQLMRSHRRTENRVQEIGEIARGLKSLARELKVPVIALSQLSRAVESRENKRPMLSDLRECVVGSTRLIDAETGRLVPIREVKGGDRVLALGERQKIGAFAVKDVWSTGVKPVFTLTTRTGRAVTATANHPFLTAQGWKRLEELAPGDILATALRLPEHGKEQSWQVHECYMAGRALAETALTDETASVPDWVFEAGRCGRRAFELAFLPREAPVCMASRRLAEDMQMLQLQYGLMTAIVQCGTERHPRYELQYVETCKGDELLWEEIKSITPAGEEEVFDIAVPGCANFLANGIVAHNSGSIEAEADMVCFLYREAYYKMKEAYSVEGADRPERQEIEETEIIVGKHRNGPTGMVKVGFMAEFAKFVQIEHRDDEPTGF